MKRALVVGINDYPNAPLYGCVNDANAIANTIETNGDGSPNFSVKLLASPGVEVTRSNLREAIEQLFSGELDMALLYFSGHGLIKSTGGYLVTKDAKKYDEGVSMDDILSLANKSKAKNKAMFRKRVEWSKLSITVVYLEVCYATSTVSNNSKFATVINQPSAK